MSKFVIATLIALTAAGLVGCDGSGSLFYEYYFTSQGQNLQKVMGNLKGAQATSHGDPSTSEPRAAANAPTQQVAYTDDAATKAALTTALGELSQSQVARSQGLTLPFISSAFAKAGAALVWPEQKLQHLFGANTLLPKGWETATSMQFEKASGASAFVLTIKRQTGTATVVVRSRLTLDADDVCQTADKVLRTQETVKMDMVNGKGERRTMAHPFGGKTCSKAELQKNFRFFTLRNLEGPGATAVPEYAVVMKKDATDQSVWVLHYQANRAETQGLTQRLASLF